MATNTTASGKMTNGMAAVSTLSSTAGEYDKRLGRGVYTRANGNRYDGDWKYDKRHGRDETRMNLA
jgi:hypothetical protein